MDLFKNKTLLSIIYLVILIIGVFLIKDQVIALFNPEEASNFTKLMTLADYVEIFNSNLNIFSLWRWVRII